MAVLHVIVPVFNESANVPSLMTALRRVRDEIKREFNCSIILVDDGSDDSTRDCVEREKKDLLLKVLRHEKNRGPGAAFATAFAYLAPLLADDDWVCTMEGDNTSRVETLLHMLVRRREGYDVVLASPYAYGGGMTGVETTRVILSHGANALAKVVLGLRGLHTLSSFFRIYSAGIVRKLQSLYGPGIVERDGFECMVELLLKLVMAQARISEVEMAVDWTARAGKSKMRRLRAMAGYANLLVKGWGWRHSAGSAFWKPVRNSPPSQGMF